MLGATTAVIGFRFQGYSYRSRCSTGRSFVGQELTRPPRSVSVRLFRQRVKISTLLERTTRFGIPTNRRGMLFPTKRTSWGRFGRGLRPRRSCSRCVNNNGTRLFVTYRIVGGDGCCQVHLMFLVYYGGVAVLLFSGAWVLQSDVGVWKCVAPVVVRYRYRSSCCKHLRCLRINRDRTRHAQRFE